MRKNIWLYVFVVALAATLAMPAIGFAQGRGNSDNARGPRTDRGAAVEQDHGGGKPETAGNRGRGNSSVQGQRDGRDDEHGPPPHAQGRGHGQDVRPTSTPGVSGLVGPQSQHGKVGICHVTGSATNRYVFLFIPDHAAAHHLAHHSKDGLPDLASPPADCEALNEGLARAALAARATTTATTTTLGLGATATRTPTATATRTPTPTATATSTGTSGSGSVTGPGDDLAMGEGNDEVEARVLGSTGAEGLDPTGMVVGGLLVLGGTLVARRLLAARR